LGGDGTFKVLGLQEILVDVLEGDIETLTSFSFFLLISGHEVNHFALLHSPTMIMLSCHKLKSSGPTNCGLESSKHLMCAIDTQMFAYLYISLGYIYIYIYFFLKVKLCFYIPTEY
jgi:hypothetical protein